VTAQLFFQRPAWSYVIRKGKNNELWEQKPKWHITLTTEPRKRRVYKAVCGYEWDSLMTGINVRDKIVNPKILCAKCIKAMETIEDAERQTKQAMVIAMAFREGVASTALDRDQTIDLGPQENQ
jgi:hypothetical protein